MRETRIALRTARARVATARPPESARSTTQSLSSSLSDAWIGASAASGGRRRPSAAAQNVSPRIGSWTAPAGRHAVDDEPDRDAEERDAVRVVDGAVERVDDPGPPAAASAGLGAVRPARPRARAVAGLLGQDPVARKRGPGSPSRMSSSRQVVDLGDHVLGRLVVDLLDPLVALEQDPPRPLGGDRPRERHVGREPARDRVGRHLPQSTVSGFTVVPSVATTASNVTVSPGWTIGL